jgi:hypothetical protein
MQIYFRDGRLLSKLTKSNTKGGGAERAHPNTKSMESKQAEDRRNKHDSNSTKSKVLDRKPGHNMPYAIITSLIRKKLRKNSAKPNVEKSDDAGTEPGQDTLYADSTKSKQPKLFEKSGTPTCRGFDIVSGKSRQDIP